MIKNNRTSFNQQNGFALIASLSIMSVLVLIAVALYSLSSVATKSSSVAAARIQAEANAKLALLKAMGELQAQLGPDQRISANASILDTNQETPEIEGVNHPHWLGVWDSWVAGDLVNAPVNPDYPSDPSEHQTIGNAIDTDGNLNKSMRPDYAQKDNHFREWLVSLDPSNADREDPNLAGQHNLDGDPTPEGDSNAVRLVGEGSLGSSASAGEYVSAGLMGIQNSGVAPQGRYAWWVGDQSQKATILADSYDSESSLTDAERIFRSQAPATMGTELLPGLASVTDESQLSKISNFKTLDLLSVSPQPGANDPKLSQLNFHYAATTSLGVLSDVREGGLKRDLSTLLERPIDLNENGDEFMLYAFDDPRFANDRSHSRVPLQDLAAYYQLYDHEPTFANQRREGVKYDSTELAESIQMSVPDYDGDAKDRDRILREYTSIYRQPVVTKVQFMIGVTAEEITAADRQHIQDQVNGTIGVGKNNTADQPIPDDDTHKLRIGVMPMVTFWNPTNLPLVMSESQVIRITNSPPIILSWTKYNGSASDVYESNSPFSLHFMTTGGNDLNGNASGFGFMSFTLVRPGGAPVIFEPGEVKIFSIADSTGTQLNDDGLGLQLTGEFNEGAIYDLSNVEFIPDRFFKLRHSTNIKRSDLPNAFVFADSRGDNREGLLVFNKNDRFSLRVDHDNADGTRYNYTGRVAGASLMRGSAFSINLTDPGYRSLSDDLSFLQHYTLLSRHGGDTNSINQEMAIFNDELLSPGFPGGTTPIEYEDYTNAIYGDQIIGAGDNDEVKGVLDFSLTMACEAGPATGGFGGGRRIASRPFLHSAPGVSPFIDKSDKASLYNFGWDWRIDRIIDIYDSNTVQAEPGTDNGFFGGGYTVEAGTTHVIQREIPVLPPISIASMSHAQLGGYSLSNAVIYEGIDPESGTLSHKESGRPMGRPRGNDFQMTTATGQGGIAPNISQAIGNSYAHPNIPAGSAFTTKTRFFDGDEAEIEDVPFVDHSYLANKALWDEYFFSSIAPQPSKVRLFGAVDRTSKDIAEAFFLNGEPLPNRRISPYKVLREQALVDSIFAEETDYTDGMADKIATHLMVDGAFNINSTSVEAWKVFLSSLKGKPVAYLDGGISPSELTTQNTPIASGILPNVAPILTSDFETRNRPPEQWKTGRVLTDTEIEELATAIVKQVKLRGPFLSLSEFINRRLDDGNITLSLKGTLQAAIDDESVSINTNFRESSRLLDGETDEITDFEFPEAAEGPIAYGSMPYMDQADILQHFSEQLTPRGDTFIIRSYGDTLDAGGKVISRAWCEAVVQRVPEYSDPTNSAHEKQDDLTATNRQFGRKLKIVSFRWLSSDEV